MAVYFKVLCKSWSDFTKVDKIAEDCGAKTRGYTLDSEYRQIEVLSHDEADALRAIYRELGYQTAKVANPQ